VRRTSLRVCGFFFYALRWHEEQSDNHLNSVYNPVMHLQFKESKIHGCDTTTEGPQGKPNKVIRENGKLLVDEPKNRSGNISKSTKLIAVSEVLGRQRFNTAVFCAIVICANLN